MLPTPRARPPPPPPPPRTNRRGGTLVSPRGQENDDIVVGDDFVQIPSAFENHHPPRQPQPQQQQRKATMQVMTHQTNHNDEWVLHIRLPNASLISIHVTPDMTADRLADCLQQSVPHAPRPVVGLFLESQPGHFVTLEHVLQQQPSAGPDTVYTVWFTPPPPQPPRPTPWYLRRIVWLILLSPLLLNWTIQYLPLVVYLVEQALFWLYQVLVQIPLHELYRYGPWFLGWEGHSLPHICAQITFHHGDKDFWVRNMEECQRIFGQKQEAWLRLARPLWLLVLSVALLGVVRYVRLTFFQPVAQPIDREMLETYRAWQTLLRQANKTFRQADAHHHHQSSHTGSHHRQNAASRRSNSGRYW